MTDNPENIKQILAKNIKKRRENLGLTQEGLAEITDLSVQTINTIEGCRMWISDKSITKLAKALNVDIFQLFMPHHVAINKLDSRQAAFLLEYHQKIKMVVGKIDSQIDKELNEILHYAKQRKNEKESENMMQTRNKPDEQKKAKRGRTR